MVSPTEPYTFSLHDALPIYEVRPDGTESLTDTLVAVLGPLLLTVMVEGKLLPRNTLPTAPLIAEPPLLSTLVTLTSFCGVRLSFSVALLFAVLVSLPLDTVT